MSLPPMLVRSPRLLAICYLAAYLVLEAVTYIPGLSPLGITPWNPSIGMSVALLIFMGVRLVPLLVGAALLSDLLIRHIAMPWWMEVIEAVAVSASYAVALWLLNRPRFAFDKSLGSIRDLILIAAVGVAGAAGAALLYVGVLCTAGMLPWSQAPSSVLRYWGGDVIGIMLLTPFLLMLLSGRQIPGPGWETLVQAATIVAVVALVLGPGAALQQNLFYLLFLPIVWIAVRSGLGAVSAGLVVMQVGLMAGLHAGAGSGVDVPAFQAVMLILSFSGLAIGSLISERERTETRIRLQQDAIARASRLASMGTLTASLAHEINQPLAAIGNYSHAVLKNLDSAPSSNPAVKDTVIKISRQVERAGEIMRGLKQLMQSGKLDLAPQPLHRIVGESIELLEPELTQQQIALTVDVSRDLPRVMADRLQIGQVLVNLLRNSIEALQAQPAGFRRLAVTARVRATSQVELHVADNGPGFPADFEIGKLAPGYSEKPHGLGIGLTICRSIVVGHGGRLLVDSSGHGASIRIHLISEQGDTDVAQS